MIRHLLVIRAGPVGHLFHRMRQVEVQRQPQQGRPAYKNSRFPEAVNYFQTAVQLEPTNKNTHQYLAIAYMSQYIPGAESPENVRMADSAIQGIPGSLDARSEDETAIAYCQALLRSEEVRPGDGVNKKLISVNPPEQGSLLHPGRDRLDAVAVAGSGKPATK
jgi:hypothetical protein